MNEEQLVNLGCDAETLLNTEAFNRVVNSLVDACVNTFLTTTAEEDTKRTQAYNHYKALNDIVSTLRQQVEVRDQINTKITETITTEEE